MKIATAEEFPAPSLQIGESVHVAGWAKGAVFRIVNTDPRWSVIETRASGKVFRVKTELLLGVRK